MPFSCSEAVIVRQRSPKILTLALAAALGAAFLAPPCAEAILLWKRKAVRPDGATAPPASREHHHRGGSAPQADAPGDFGTTGGPELAASAAAALGARPEWRGAPPPPVVRVYGHERPALESAAAALYGTRLPDAEAAAAHLRYGNALARIGRDAEAGAAYAEAIRLLPELQAAWTNLGSLLLQARESGLALSVLDTALSLDPQSGLAWFVLGGAREAAGDGDGAADAYLRALELDPGLWLPSRNPMIVGNEMANRALHARYLRRGAAGTVLLEDSP